VKNPTDPKISENPCAAGEETIRRGKFKIVQETRVSDKKMMTVLCVLPARVQK